MLVRDKEKPVGAKEDGSQIGTSHLGRVEGGWEAWANGRLEKPLGPYGGTLLVPFPFLSL